MAEFNGPLFDGAASVAAARYREEAEREVAEEGQNLVLGRLIQVIRKPTPYYWTQIKTIARRGGLEVTGEDVIYHWWLEGVGSRNFPVTRFKGYRTFELMTHRLRARAQSVAERVLPEHLRRMGGS